MRPAHSGSVKLPISATCRPCLTVTSITEHNTRMIQVIPWIPLGAFGMRPRLPRRRVGMNASRKVLVTVSMDSKLLTELNRLAKESRTDCSEIVNEAVDKFLDRWRSEDD